MSLPILRTNVYGDRKYVRKARGFLNAAKRLHAYEKACRRPHEKAAVSEAVGELLERGEKLLRLASILRVSFVPPEDLNHPAYLQTGKPAATKEPRGCAKCGWRLPDNIEGYVGGCPVCLLRTCASEQPEGPQKWALHAAITMVNQTLKNVTTIQEHHTTEQFNTTSAVSATISFRFTREKK